MEFQEKITQWVSKNTPLILTTGGVIGIFVTAGFTGKATLEAAEVVKRLDATVDGTLTKREIVEAVWKIYIPPLLIGVATAACIVGTHSIHTRRNAALLSVYSLTEVALREYKDKVVETIGENKERKIHDEIMQDRVNENPPSSEIIVVGTGKVQCMEAITGRYFESDMESIRRAENDINSRLIHDMYCSHNEFCSLVGLPQTPLGDQIGWTTDHMMEIVFTSAINPKNGTPVLVVDYRISPKSDYYNLH